MFMGLVLSGLLYRAHGGDGANGGAVLRHPAIDPQEPDQDEAFGRDQADYRVGGGHVRRSGIMIA